MSNRSSVGGKYLSRIFKSDGADNQSDRVVRYDEMILHKQRNRTMRKRKLERQNKRKARR